MENEIRGLEETAVSVTRISKKEKDRNEHQKAAFEQLGEVIQRTNESTSFISQSWAGLEETRKALAGDSLQNIEQADKLESISRQFINEEDIQDL